MKFFDKLLDAIYPNHITCLVCGNDLKELNDYDVCLKCFDKFPLNNGHICIKCGTNIWGAGSYCNVCKKGLRHFTQAREPLLYDKKVKYLIRQFKYHNQKYLAETFAKIMKNEYILSRFEVDIVMPVPMFYNRKKERGYNHSELLAKSFCKLTNLPINVDNFIRIKDTKQLAKMNKDEREENIKDAFRVMRPQEVKDKNILLIDDVITTGTTVDECARILFDCGAKSVYVLALAHTPTRNQALKKNIYVNSAKSFDKLSKILYNSNAHKNK